MSIVFVIFSFAPPPATLNYKTKCKSIDIASPNNEYLIQSKAADCDCEAWEFTKKTNFVSGPFSGRYLSICTLNILTGVNLERL